MSAALPATTTVAALTETVESLSRLRRVQDSSASYRIGEQTHQINRDPHDQVGDGRDEAALEAT